MSLGAVIWATLAVLSAASVVFGRPWTVVLSQRRYPVEMRRDPTFLETNRVITLGWTIYFVLAAAGSAVGPGWTPIVFAVMSGALSPLSFRFGESYSNKQLVRRGVGSAR